MFILMDIAVHQQAQVAPGLHLVTLEQGGAGPGLQTGPKTYGCCHICIASVTPRLEFLHAPTHGKRASAPRRFICLTAGDFGGADVERKGHARSHWKCIAEARTCLVELNSCSMAKPQDHPSS